MRAHNTVLVTGLCVLLGACQRPVAQDVPGALPASQFDRDFVTSAYQIILFDRAEGKMAQTEAQDPEVRQLAGKLVGQADEFDAHLSPIAATLGIEPPTILDYDRRLRIGHMRLQRGLDFDATYLSDQITSHQDAVNSQEMMMSKVGEDSRLVALSRTGLNLIRTNLATLRELRRKMMMRGH